MRCRFPIWLRTMLCIGLIVGIGGGAIVYTTNRQASAALIEIYASFSTEVSTNMADAVDSIVQSMRDASLAVDVFEPRLATCGAPPVNHTGEVLLRALTALPDGDTGGKDAWLSLGLMQRAGAQSTAKWSWQMAAGFGCPDHIYAYIDQQTAPAFVGYCARLTPANAFELSKEVAYNGTDWGFSPLEQQMLFKAELNESFVPVNALLGVLEFSYRRLVRCDGKPYALVFASRSIEHLNLALAAQRNGNAARGDNVAFIIERTTGLMIAASVANQTHVAGTDKRIKAFDAPDARIRAATAYLVESIAGAYSDKPRQPKFEDELYVSSMPYAAAPGIDWLLVVATDSSKIKAPLQQDAAATLTTVIVVVVITTLLAGLVTFLLVSIPVRRLLKAPRGSSVVAAWWTPDEIDDIGVLLGAQEKEQK